MERVSLPKFISAVLYFITVELACYGYTHNGGYVESEREALLDFKSGIKDHNNRLSSWRGANYCSWLGITCENGTGFVISIDLHNPIISFDLHDPYPRENIHGNLNSMNLGGEIRPSLGELKHLRYLDLSFNSFQAMPIPQFFGSLHNLIYLNLSQAGFFYGNVPSNLGNLSNLQYLDLSSNPNSFDMGFGYLYIDDIEWLTSLISLKYLSLDFVDLALVGTQLAKALYRLPNLTKLHLSGCYLNGSFPFGLGDELPNLQYLDLSLNFDLHGNISQLLSSERWRKLEFLNLEGIGLYGLIPSTIGSFCNLKYLDLSGNYLNGSLPASIEGYETCGGKSALPNLMVLYMTFSQLRGKLPDWLGEVKNLRLLDLSSNHLEGITPNSLWTLQHLKYVALQGNNLTGSLPESIGQLSQLYHFDVSSNHLSGTLTEQHFWNLSKLDILYIGSNSFHLNVSPNWIPPFQVYLLDMDSCHLGPSFPTWLKSQNNLKYLHFSNASISSPIPNWFWSFSFHLESVNLSHNQIHGHLPNSLNFSNNKYSGPLPLDYLDLSNNKFTSVIPDSIGHLTSLKTIDLSQNKFIGVIPDSIRHLTSLGFISFSRNNLIGTIPNSIGHLTSLEVIDFSMNSLIGSIPSVLNNCSVLAVIDLGNNNFSGEIPNSLGHLKLLQSLHLNHNKLSGALPTYFQNLSSLQVLDMSYNKLSSEVPTWIGFAFPNLVILNLRSNVFYGRLPSQLSNLSSLHFLNIAQNNLIGEIPHTLGELKAMAEENMTIYELLTNLDTSSYEERLVVETKGQSLEYTRTLSLVVAIDLSNNNLSGRFPQGITKLFGLVVLNLSRNHITGQIPENISMLHQLSSLDLSSNELSGTIPLSMAALTFLSYLNLSENKLSGKIPFTGQMITFNEISFVGNCDLCGPPLARKCRDEDSSRRQFDVDNKNGGGYVDQWFYLSIGLGFATGILVPYIVLVIRKSWCEAYFDFVDGIVKWLLRGRMNYTKHHQLRG